MLNVGDKVSKAFWGGEELIGVVLVVDAPPGRAQVRLNNGLIITRLALDFKKITEEEYVARRLGDALEG